jgi:hypothetical protein
LSVELGHHRFLLDEELDNLNGYRDHRSLWVGWL